MLMPKDLSYTKGVLSVCSVTLLIQLPFNDFGDIGVGVSYAGVLALVTTYADSGT
jgi:hypothetical protein